MAKYVLVTVMCDSDLERMLEVPSKHPSINTLELFLDVKPTASVVPPPADFSWSMAKPSGPSKRQKRTQPANKDEPKNYSYADGKGKGKGKSKEPPSDEELRNAILDILKVMDFKMASFTDIIKQLADKFRYNLTARKSSIEVMIQYELEKYAADSEEEEEEDEGEEEEEEDEEGLW
uniref:DEK-C domain-containing protein n=1 Tax=Brassica campestris TaxID=3711 RepID=M4EG35_BRACM